MHNINQELDDNLYGRRGRKLYTQERHATNWPFEEAVFAAPFWLKYVAQSTHSRGWSYEHRASEMSVIEIPLNGTLYVEFDNRELAVRPGYGCLLPAGEFNRLYTRDSEIMRKITFAFAGSCSSLILSALTGNTALFRLAKPEETVMSYYTRLRSMIDEGDMSKFPLLTGLAMEFAMEITASRQISGGIPEIMLEAQNIINTGIGDCNLTAGRVANMLHISVYSLNKLFCQYTGETVSRHMEKIRMAKAMQLLQNGGCTVKNAAMRLGYSSAFSFSAAFRKYYGIPPAKIKGGTEYAITPTS